MVTAACFCAILDLVLLVLSSLKLNASVVVLKTFVGVDTSCSLAETSAIVCWIAISTSVERFATMVIVLRVGNARFTDVVVVR